MRFAGKTIVITGGTSGIGRGTVDLFLAEGAQVVVGDIDEAEGMKMASHLGESFHFIPCDVTKTDQIKALMDGAAHKTGGIDYVFNNAGSGGPRAPIDEITEDEWDFAQALLLKSVAMGMRYAAPHLKARGGGVMINTASVCAHSAGFGPIAYSVAKAGVMHLSKVGAAELAQYNIRVNAICPGFIHTNIFAATLSDNADERAIITSAIGQMAAGFQPIPSPGQPKDIAEAVAYFCSDAGRYVTGIQLTVDGGLLVGPRHSWDPEAPGMFDAIDPEKNPAMGAA